MNETLSPESPLRELDYRNSDGIDVRMLWDKDSDEVSVDVNDSKTGEAFIIPVLEGENANHIFQHPFAYADRAGNIALSGSQES